MLMLDLVVHDVTTRFERLCAPFEYYSMQFSFSLSQIKPGATNLLNLQTMCVLSRAYNMLAQQSMT